MKARLVCARRRPVAFAATPCYMFAARSSQVEPSPPPPPPPPPPILAVAAWWRAGRVVRMRKSRASARLASPVSSNGVWFGRAFLLKSVV